jgi:membrane-bound ClpP family serine protease
MADLSINTVPIKDARDILKTLRAGRGGRTSRYQQIVEDARKAKAGQVVTVTGVAKTQVQPLRTHVLKHLDGSEWKVKSAASKEDGTYVVVVGRKADFE